MNNINIDTARLPQHVAIVMDGNGRWAQQKGAQRIFGHQKAVKAVRSVVEGCVELGIRFLTLYAFSTENWHRPRQEVDALMKLLVETIDREIDDLHRNGVSLQIIGDISRLPSYCVAQLNKSIETTKNNDKLILVVALSYSGRWEIVEATKKVHEDIMKGKISCDHLTEELFATYLDSADLPDPELWIRTGGETRISNFLLWQIAYTELYFTKTFWPDFRKEDLRQAVCAYQERNRRFGRLQENLQKS